MQNIHLPITSVLTHAMLCLILQTQPEKATVILCWDVLHGVFVEPPSEP